MFADCLAQLVIKLVTRIFFNFLLKLEIAMSSHTYHVPVAAAETINVVEQICKELTRRQVPGLEHFRGFPRRITTGPGNLPGGYPTPEIVEQISKVDIWYPMVGYVSATVVATNNTPHGSSWAVSAMTIRPRGLRIAIRFNFAEILNLMTVAYRRDCCLEENNSFQLAAQEIAARTLLMVRTSVTRSWN